MLSILICHIPSRKTELDKLLNVLTPQIVRLTNDVEMIINSDTTITVGEKRNQLIQSARGEYVSFVDDDDLVSADYVDKILNALETEPDCVGIEGLMQYKELKTEFVFKHSIQYAGWYSGPDAFYRTPNHLNPVKRSIMLQVRFPELNRGEDIRHSKLLRKYLKTEVYVEGPIYFYQYTEKPGDFE